MIVLGLILLNGCVKHYYDFGLVPTLSIKYKHTTLTCGIPEANSNGRPEILISTLFSMYFTFLQKQKAIFLLPTAGTSQLRNHLHVPSTTPATSCGNTLPNCTLLLAVEKTAV